jgi:hypothetical protein
MSILTVIMIVLVAPSLMAASMNSFGAAKAVAISDGLIEVPLVVTNQTDLAALDIPLTFSEGVTLKEVDFTNTRVDYFDLKVANIDNEKHRVLIGLLPQISSNDKADLAAGTGSIAMLRFEVTDHSIDELTISTETIEAPYHSLAFVYHENAQIQMETPEFETITISLANLNLGPQLPEEFSLSQNYPNPFNPTTYIDYALPKAANVNLTIYNVLGQKVVTLVDAYQEAGIQKAEFDASNNASGIYFYRLSAGDFTETKKMMLLK